MTKLSLSALATLSKNKYYKILQNFLLLMCLILMDQLTKFLAGEASLVIENKGVSFGLWNGFGLEIYLQLILLIVLLYVLYKSVMPNLLRTLLISGVISNTIDRVFLGGMVRDWLLIPFIPIKNNFADWYIFWAIVIFVIKYSYEYRNNLRR